MRRRLGLIAISSALMLATALTGVTVFSKVSAHGGDADLNHHCVEPTSGKTRTAFPVGPKDANFDCESVGWNNLHTGVSVYLAGQETAIVPPGQFGSVRSRCDLGDFVLSGGVVVFAEDFRMNISDIVIDGATGEQSWVFSGNNEGTGDADIRVAARCLNH